MGMLPVKAVYHFFVSRLCAYQCSRCDFCYLSQHQSWTDILLYCCPGGCVLPLAYQSRSLWRINRVHNPVALICEKKLLVAVPWSFINSDYHISFRAFYMPVEYNEVAGVSHNWSQLYIGARITGGLVALPVQLSYVSLGDKADFQNWVERKQEEVMENT